MKTKVPNNYEAYKLECPKECLDALVNNYSETSQARKHCSLLQQTNTISESVSQDLSLRIDTPKLIELGYACYKDSANCPLYKMMAWEYIKNEALSQSKTTDTVIPTIQLMTGNL